MKFCPKCGKKIPSTTARFCGGCGLNLVEYRQKLQSSTASVPEKNQPSQAVAVVPKKNQLLQPVAVTKKNLSAEELLERGISLQMSKLYQEAVTYYEKAIQLGNAEAMLRLGKCYFYGEGVEKDLPKCLEWYLKASQAGNAKAMILAAEIFNENSDVQAKKFGVKKDNERAKKLLETASQSGDINAISDLGAFHCGEGNFPAAYALWTTALNFGKTDMLDLVGTLYFMASKDNQKNFAKGLQCHLRDPNSTPEQKDELAYLFNQKAAMTEAFNPEKNSFEFRIGEYTVTFGKYLENLVKIMSRLRPKLNETLAKFTTFYVKKGNIDDVVNKAYGYGLGLLEDFAGEGIRLLSERGQRGRITARDFINDRFPSSREIPAEIWGTGAAKIERIYQEIVDTAQNERDYRQARKENRAR